MSIRNREEILQDKHDREFKRDQANAARLVVKDMARSGRLNQKSAREVSAIKQHAALDGNHMLTRFAHEILCLRRRMRERDRIISHIEHALRRKGKPARAVDPDGTDRSVVELRRLARKRLRAQSGTVE